MRKTIVLISLFCALAAGAKSASRHPMPATPVFCADNSTKTPCSVMPTEAATNIGYQSFPMMPALQNNFDNLSWQAFIALNWPVNDDGTANTAASLTSDQTVPRVWDDYKRSSEIFLPDGQTPDSHYPSSGLSKGAVLTMLTKAGRPIESISSFNESTVHLPLIDSNGNFVVYDVAVNKTAFQYIFNNGLYNGNTQLTKTSIQFPVGSVVIKTAWKVLVTGKDDPSAYITRTRTISIPATNSVTGQPFTTPPLQMGLIAMHIVTKTPKETTWVWSSFEHVDNAPLSARPLKAVAKLPKGHCPGPANATLMSLYNPACTSCVVNQPPVSSTQTVIWQTSQPYAKNYLVEGKYGTQIVRCTAIYDGDANVAGTASLNRQWQQALPKPYSNYKLIGTQWEQATDTPTPRRRVVNGLQPPDPGSQIANGGQALNGGKLPDDHIPGPPYLQNTAAESYVQNGSLLPDGIGSCLGCHYAAQDAACINSDLSFLLSHAQPVPTCSKQRNAFIMKTLRALQHK